MNFPPSTAEDTQILSSEFGTSMAAGTLRAPVPFDVRGFSSFYFGMKCHYANASFLSHVMHARLVWYPDAFSFNLPLYNEIYSWFPFNNTLLNGQDSVMVQGPVHGPFMSLQLQWTSPSALLFVDNIQLLGTTRILPNNYHHGNGPGDTSSQDLLLGLSNIVIAAGINQQFALDPGYGRVHINVLNLGANNAGIVVRTFNEASGTFVRAYNNTLAAGASLNDEFILGKGATYVELSSAAGTTLDPVTMWHQLNPI